MFSRYFLCSISFLLIGFLSGCRSDKLPEPSQAELLTQKIFGKEGHFRGNQIGDPLEEVLEIDRDYLFKRRNDELNYSVPLAVNDSAHYDIAYVFDHNKLFEIQVDVLLNSEKKTEQLFEAFVSHMKEKYGDPSEKPDYAFWDITDQGRRLEITLRDVSREYERPFLSLNIIEPERFDP